MNRFVLTLALASCCLTAGCSTTKEAEAPPQPSTGDYKGESKIRFKSEPAPSNEPGALDYVAVPFENVLYIPWKFIGGGGKGAVDGVSAGFGKDRMPVAGLLFSPVNLIVGFFTGAVEGLAISPGFVGPRDGFGRAMEKPTKHSTTIWWY